MQKILLFITWFSNTAKPWAQLFQTEKISLLSIWINGEGCAIYSKYWNIDGDTYSWCEMEVGRVETLAITL